MVVLAQQRQSTASDLTTTESTPRLVDLIAEMTTDATRASSLDAETTALVRIAALAATDAPALAYALTLGADADVDPEHVRGVLAAVAPIVGTPRIEAAIVRADEALGLEIAPPTNPHTRNGGPHDAARK